MSILVMPKLDGCTCTNEDVAKFKYCNVCKEKYIWLDEVYIWWFGLNDGSRCTCSMEWYHNKYHTKCWFHWNCMFNCNFISLI